MALVSLLLFLLLQHISEGSPCIKNYGELKEAILNNTENQEDLLFGFYPPNQSPSHIITVYYYITPSPYEDEFNSTAANYTFQWVDSSTLLLMEWRLFDALSFGIAELKEYNMSIIVSPGFCDESEAENLLNMATIWLKSYAVSSLEKDHYYALYYDKEQEKYIVYGNDLHGTTRALIAFEYLAAVGSVIAFYILLLLTRFSLFQKIGEFFSEISTSCVILMLVMLIKDLISYSEAYSSSTVAWYYTFPLPVVFLLWSIANITFSVLVVMFIGKEFPLPGMLNFIHMHWCFKKSKIVKRLLQVILVFSITSVALLVAFHFVWILLAFSAYPIRSIASQAFTIPLLSLILSLFYLADTLAKAPGLLRQAGNKLKKFVFAAALSAMAVPIIIGLSGVLYYYSQALIKINETENNPIKTIIAGLAPTVVAALLAWTARKATLYIGKTTNEPLDDSSGSTNYKATGMKQNESKALEEVNASSTYESIKGDDDDLLPF